MPQDTRISSRARRTIAILRDHCGRCGLNSVPFVERLLEGFRRYGCDNHLAPDFSLRQEDVPEGMDHFIFAAVGVSRAEYDDDDPNLNARLRATAEAYQRSQLRPWQYPGRPLVVYVSGPYTAPTPERVAEHVAAAERAAWEIMHKGHVPVCPHSMTHQWERGGFGWQDFLRVDLLLLERCDAICMVGRWQDSSGAVLERDRAEELRLWVFEGTQRLPAYIANDDMPDPLEGAEAVAVV